jgi:WD40 repeat protein
VWDVALGRQIQYFVDHKAAVTAAAFAPDNKTIVSGGADNALQVNVVSVLRTHVADEKRVNDLSLAANGALYATAGDDGSVKLWDFGSGNPVRAFPGHQGPVLSVAIRADNQQIAGGGKDHALFLWNLNDAQVQYKITTPSEVLAAAYSADNKKLIAAGSDQIIRSYDPTPPNPPMPNAKSPEPIQELKGHAGPIAAIAFAPDNRLALSASADGSLKTWGIAAGSFTLNLAGHASQVYGVAFSADGQTLASVSNDKTVRLWDLKQPNQVKALPAQGGAIYAIVYSPDGTQFVTAGADKTVRLHAAADGKEIRQFAGAADAVYSVAFSHDGQTVAAAGVDHRISLWNIGGQPLKTLEGHKDDIYRVQFNPSGTKLMSIGYAGTVNVWDINTGMPVFSTKLPAVLYSGCYTPDGKRIAVTANDGKTYLVDLPPQAL